MCFAIAAARFHLTVSAPVVYLDEILVTRRAYAVSDAHAPRDRPRSQTVHRSKAHTLGTLTAPRTPRRFSWRPESTRLFREKMPPDRSVRRAHPSARGVLRGRHPTAEPREYRAVRDQQTNRWVPHDPHVPFGSSPPSGLRRTSGAPNNYSGVIRIRQVQGIEAPEETSDTPIASYFSGW